MEFIPWIISGIACLFAVLTYVRAGHKDEIKDKADVQARLSSLSESLIKANIKLDQVCATTTETRADIKSLNTSISEIDKRVSALENNLKTAFMRIDELREELKHGMVER